MKLKVEITKIYCAKTTIEWTPDEIYFAFIVTKGRKKENSFIPINNENPFGTAISEVKEMKKGNLWKQENSFEFDLGDAEMFCINFGLYEKDNGELYNEMKTNLSELLEPDKFDWKEFISNIKIPENPDNLTEWIVPLFNTGKYVYKHFRQDDEIGNVQFGSKLNNSNLSLPFEYKLRGIGAKYDVGFKLTIIN